MNAYLRNVGLAVMATIAFGGCAALESAMTVTPKNATDYCIDREVRNTRRFSENSFGGTAVDLTKITPACIAQNNGQPPSFYAGATVTPAPTK